MATYPVSLVLEGRAVLVVGGGAVATRKVEGLLSTGAVVTVVSPKLTDALRTLVDDGRCAWVPKNYEACDLTGVDLVFVATDNEAVNAQVYDDASRAHLLTNVADRPELCSFYLPSVLRRGKLSIAVSTEGSSPLSARRLRDECATLVPDRFEDYLELLGEWRPRVIAALPDESERYRFWEQATDGQVLGLVERGEVPAAEMLLEGILVELRFCLDRPSS